LSAALGRRRSGLLPCRRHWRLSCGFCWLNCFLLGFSRPFDRLSRRGSGRTCRRRFGAIPLRARRRLMRGHSRPGRNHRSDRFAFRDGLRCCKNGRTPVIHGSKLLAVLSRLLLLLQLRGHRRNTPFTHCGGLRRERPASDASRAVVAGAVNRRIVDCDVVDDDRIRYRAVISRRPQETNFWRPRPCAGDPVVPLRSIAPISGLPQISVTRAFRLRIFRQRWRRLRRLKHRLPVA
jgi:hypothetical protein